MSDSTKLILKTIPELPGVYQFLNKEKKIIYVGKAINLKKRVRSYFQKNIKSRKTINLVKNISHIEHVVVQSRFDGIPIIEILDIKSGKLDQIKMQDEVFISWDHERESLLE